MYIVDDKNKMVFWDWDKNNQFELYPDKITTGARTVVYWKCPKCQQCFAKQVREMNKCPYCTGHRIKEGINDLTTTNPKVLAEWDYSRNSIKPSEVTKGSHKKVFWVCKNGHSYESMIKSKIDGRGCPYCANKKAVKGINDLTITNPSLCLQWNFEKNNDNPTNYLRYSKKKVWWKCDKGHEWINSIENMTRGSKCPYCYPHKDKNKHDSFTIEHPSLLSEWDFSKNAENPENYTSSSNKKVYWKCKNGHIWQATISDRCRGYRCPKCSKDLRTSFPEKALYFYVNKYFNNVCENYRSEWLGTFEVDVYLPDYKIGIEYDGYYGHGVKNSLDRDLRKNKKCFEYGVTLIRVRENKCPLLNSTSIDIQMKKSDDIQGVIIKVLRRLAELTKKNISIVDEEININLDYDEIVSLVGSSKKKSSLREKYPRALTMWDYDKNKSLTPENISYMSSKKVWWRCKNGHEWTSCVSNMVKSLSCPYCSGKRVLEGFNDLCTKNQSLASEWDYDKNILKPNQVTCGSGKKVWWKCVNGHSWNASVVSRNRGNGCPICSNRKLLKGYNDIASMPDLIIKWNYDRNKEKPDEVCIGSSIKKWWKCNICGKEWQAIPRRVSCPRCANMNRKKKK